jgi:hypothetical protein
MTNDANEKDEVLGYAIYKTAIASVGRADLPDTHKRYAIELLEGFGQTFTAWLEKTAEGNPETLVHAMINVLGVVILHTSLLCAKRGAPHHMAVSIALALLDGVMDEKSASCKCPQCQEKRRDLN